MNNKVLSIIGLCQRAGRLASGELSCENAVREGSAKLIILAGDASDNTVKKFRNKADYYKIKLITAGTKSEIGRAIGKEVRTVLIIKDEGFAKKIEDLLNIDNN